MNILKILESGPVINFFTVIIGTAIGLLIKKGIPNRVRTTLMTAMALCVLYIGVTGLFQEDVNILAIIFCSASGAVIGELIDLDKMINNLGLKLESSFKNKYGKIAEGFIAATLLFCVGAMTVVGSVEAGIKGDNSTLYSKSVIDCVTSLCLASSLGIGVVFSAFSVLAIEGGIALLANFIAPVLSDASINHMSVIGSLLIIALSLNMLGITKIKVMNYTPALILPLLLFLKV
ncbi:MAG: DUF554 domain-containing protein [Clostridia bacterium]|nr:DUF554 domain-containing protein [Clostridia bacterium]